MLKRFWNWMFPHKHVVRIYLQGGHAVDVRCTDWKFETNNSAGRTGGRYIGYEFDGLDHYVSFDSQAIVAFEVLK